MSWRQKTDTHERCHSPCSELTESHNSTFSWGEVLTVKFEIDCKEYYGRWYNSITAWKVERENQQPVATEAPAVPPPSSEIFNQQQNEAQKNDDLPF